MRSVFSNGNTAGDGCFDWQCPHLAVRALCSAVIPGGGKLDTGRVLDYREKENRKMCSLYLSLMDKFGIRLPEFGDSNERLAEV